MRRKRPLPEFQNIEEMAQFWDSHDSTMFEEAEVEEVEYEPKRLVLSVRFEPGDMISLTRTARQFGMDRSTFVRFVVKQFLRKEITNKGPSETSATVEGKTPNQRGA